MKNFLALFLRWCCLFIVLLLATSGILLLTKASGNIFEIAKDPYWDVAKWYILDLHAVFGLALVPLLALCTLIRVQKKSSDTPEQKRRVLKATLPAVVALLTIYLVTNFLLDVHPLLVNRVYVTEHPASSMPDQITLTCGDDPTSTMTVQWRTGKGFENTRLRFREDSSAEWIEHPVNSTLVEDPQVINDPAFWRHEAELIDLNPATTYSYQVGDGNIWSDIYTFDTAPDKESNFSFVYMGDVQNGFDDWGNLREAGKEHYADAAFTILAGDLVSSGGERPQWDAFFYNACELFAERPLYPCLGNHDDDHNGSFANYLAYFDLPENGPDTLTPERAYTFQYANALFIMLDSNLDPETQTEWLEKQLSESDADWKIPVFHHPVYSSKSSRDNPEIRHAWSPLFEKYGVKIVLQGHDHAYMRTHPMLQETIATDPKTGITYIVSVAGTKYYAQDDEDYIAVGYEDLSTYQVINIDGTTLTYKAYDLEGNIVDELTIKE